ncbi:MAG: GNAT family N-acetyltransferase [Caulobacter sp.]|nr:GNAT family N-acetyltransferase [Caulobacter sp.]
MDARIKVEAVTVDELGDGERASWAALRAANPLLGSPYFDIRYVEAAGRVAPGGRVAVIRRGERTVGFLPFQRRGGGLQPLGAPMSDFHGLIADPAERIDLFGVVRALGGARLRVSGLVGAETRPGLNQRHAMIADLSDGFEAYQAGRSAAFLKDKRRRMRALERDHGEVTFSFERPSPVLLELVVTQKRGQIRRTHQHDIFACGWTVDLLRELDARDDPDFGLRLAVLRAGGKVVAAELGLTGGDRHHLWFPIYDPAYGRYSPGALMTLETLRVAAQRGVRRVDFGPSEETYKEDFADPAEPAFEGLLTPEGSLMRRLDDLVLAERMRAVTRRLGRRFDRIAACEPGMMGQIRGASSLMAGLTARHPAVGAGLGLGAGGLTLLTLFTD